MWYRISFPFFHGSIRLCCRPLVFTDIGCFIMCPNQCQYTPIGWKGRNVVGERGWCHCSKYCRRLQQQRCIFNLAGQEASRGNCINFNFKPKPEPEQCDLSGSEKNRTLINIRPLQSLPRDLNRWIKAAVGKRREEKGTLCGQTHIASTFSGSAVNTSLMTYFFILLCS